MLYQIHVAKIFKYKYEVMKIQRLPVYVLDACVCVSNTCMCVVDDGTQMLSSQEFWPSCSHKQK